MGSEAYDGRGEEEESGGEERSVGTSIRLRVVCERSGTGERGEAVKTEDRVGWLAECREFESRERSCVRDEFWGGRI